MFKHSIIITAFLFWVLPLGVFIKPSDEKKVCGGQRAICLCSHVAKGQAGASKKTVFSAPSSPEKEASPSGNGPHFLTADFRNINSLATSKLLTHSPNLYSLTICKSIEHVPKA